MNIRPVDSRTVVDRQTKEWLPDSFGCLRNELSQIATLCKAAHSLVLFRGHSRREWLLDSKFVRSVKERVFGMGAGEIFSQPIAESEHLHLALLNLYLLKYGVQVHPSAELETVGTDHGVDPWWELMRRHQQHPENDRPPFMGSHLIDWSRSFDVALYFANSDRYGEGALYVCDASATGKTHSVKSVGETLALMREVGNSGKPLGCPLLFHPPRQITDPRPDNQQVVYFAQMDLRYDLETQWRMRENERPGETILIKLILPAGTETEVADYLDDKGITKGFLFPD